LGLVTGRNKRRVYQSVQVFLLILCDSIQDEGRITNTSKKIDANSIKENKIDLKNTQLNEWIESKKTLKDVKSSQDIIVAFANVKLVISVEARIYKFKSSDKKWKIIDKINLFIIEHKQGYFVI